MDASIFYFLFFFLAFTKVITASPQLRPRDDENPLGWLNLFKTGGDIIQNLEDLPELFETPEPSTPPPKPHSNPSSLNRPSNNYDIKIEQDQQAPILGPPTPNNCDPNSPASSSRSCERATSQVIYPRKCAHNDELTAALNDVIRPKVVKTYIDNTCGVSFYSASLTSAQKAQIQKIKGIKGVARNIKISQASTLKSSKKKASAKNWKSTEEDEDSADGEKDPISLNNDGDEDELGQSADVADMNGPNDLNIDTALPDYILKRNEFDYVTARPDRKGNLAFISTPASRRISAQYVSFRKSGHGTRLYLICSGVDASHETFFRAPFRAASEGAAGGAAGGERSEPVIKGQLIAEEAVPFGVIDESYTDGTCAASVSVGDPFGVTLYPDIIVVKIGQTMVSFLSGFLGVLNDLDAAARRNPSKPLIGYTVVEAFGYWQHTVNMDPSMLRELVVHEDQARHYISRLITEWQALVVVPATSGHPENPNIDTFPALLSLYEEFPIIVTGAVNLDGTAARWSPTGPQLTVSAPGRAVCAGLAGVDTELSTPVIAAAHVVGLALYFLSLDGLGRKLRETQSTPKAVRDFILHKAQERRGGPRAIWNGLDPYAAGDYGWSYLEFFGEGGRRKG